MWMLYGATGYTGKLIVAEAVERGHKPLLAGRSEAKLKPLARQYGLDYLAFSLDDPPALQAALDRVELVLHAAGPYTFTARPMLDACLATGTHYLDLSGDIPVMERTFHKAERAAERGIVLINGVGFDVIPTECLAAYVAAQVADPTELELAFAISGGASGGTLKGLVEFFQEGGRVRRDGQYVSQPVASTVKSVRFPHGEMSVMSRSMGELASIYRSTGIPNITTMMALPRPAIRWIRRLRGVLGLAFYLGPVRRLFRALVGAAVDGPGETQREAGFADIYVRVSNAQGASAEGWMHTREAYSYTAIASVLAVERVLDGSYAGALTPAMAFGPDFALDVPGTTRYDSLPATSL